MDAAPGLVNQAYIVCAHIQEVAPRGRWGTAEEKFTAICLPGMLPGFYMGFNHHGFAYTVNAISTGNKIQDAETLTRKSQHYFQSMAFSNSQLFISARHFICRALLSVSNMFDANEILQDEGRGISNGVTINMNFCRQEGVPLFHNAEVAPPVDPKMKESQLSVLTLSPGESLTVCNKYVFKPR